MSYLKINKILFILINLVWAIIVIPVLLFFLFTNESSFDWQSLRFLVLIAIMGIIQVVGYYKLNEGNIYYASVAVIVLSFIIDFDGFKLLNTMLLNIDMIYAAGGEFIFQIRFLDGPSSTWNVRLTDLKFNQIGFNAVGLIQLFFLLEQETYKDKNSLNDESENRPDTELETK